jgi:hypothetical protein
VMTLQIRNSYRLQKFMQQEQLSNVKNWASEEWYIIVHHSRPVRNNWMRIYQGFNMMTYHDFVKRKH